MKSDLLLKIKSAESEADGRVAAAEVEAKAIVADARRQAEAILAEGRAQTDFAHQSRIETARKAAETEATKTVAAGQKKAAETKKRVEAGLPAAIERSVKLFEERL